MNIDAPKDWGFHCGLVETESDKRWIDRVKGSETRSVGTRVGNAGTRRPAMGRWGTPGLGIVKSTRAINVRELSSPSPLPAPRVVPISASPRLRVPRSHPVSPRVPSHLSESAVRFQFENVSDLDIRVLMVANSIVAGLRRTPARRQGWDNCRDQCCSGTWSTRSWVCHPLYIFIARYSHSAPQI